MAFHESVFPYALQYGMSITLRYKTSIVTTQSLHEERLCQWLDCLRSYAITPVILDKDGFQELGAFFRARSGRTHAFRLHDPIDNALVDQPIGTGDSVRYSWQVYKSYDSGIAGDTYTAKRPLLKLVAPVIVSVNSVVRTFPITDLNTGLINFAVKAVPFTVSYIAPDKITRTDGGNFQTDGVLVGDTVVTSGGASLNGNYLVNSFADGGASIIQATATFVGTTSTTVTMRVPPPITQVVRVTCGFHTPIRFATNRLGTTHATFEHYNPQGVVMVEDRLQSQLLTNSNIVEESIPGFVEARYPFDTQLSDESEFSSKYSDQVITFDSGFEQRARRSAQGYNDYAFKYEVKPLTEIQRLIAFFHARKGRFGGFRLKDINDFEAGSRVFGQTDGETYEFQLQKQFHTGSGSHEARVITKPVEGTVSLFLDAVLLNLTTEHITINYATGKVLFFLGNLSLSTNSGLKTFNRLTGSWVTDGLTIGDKISLTGSVSNNLVFTVTAVTALALTVSETVVTEVAVLMSVYLPPLTGGELTWTGEFDVAARFNTDELQVSINGYESYNGDNLSFQEIHTEAVEVIYNEQALAATGPIVCAGRASAILSAPEVAMENPVFQMSYSILGGPSKEVHNTLVGSSAWTFFAVISHSQRGVFFEIPQPTIGGAGMPLSDGNSVYFRMQPNSLGTRVFIRNKPTNKAVLYIEGWSGANKMAWADDGFGNESCRIYNNLDLVRSGELDTPLYVSPEGTVYEPMTVVIVTLSYFSSRAYVSGSAAGIVQVGDGGGRFESYDCDSENGQVITNPTDRYVQAVIAGSLFYGAIFGAFTANIGTHTPITGGPLGRVYEAYFAQYYKSITAETELVIFKALHDQLIRYLEAKYLYRRKVSLAMEGTRGHWLMDRDTLFTTRSGAYPDEHLTRSEVGETVNRWLTDIHVGSLHLVDKSPQGMFPTGGGTLVAVDPDYEMLTEPLRGFWE